MFKYLHNLSAKLEYLIQFRWAVEDMYRYNEMHHIKTTATTFFLVIAT